MTQETSSGESINAQRIVQMRAKLEAQFTPVEMELLDQSHLHAGHAGARSGKGHFDLMIVSEQFRDQNLIQRHRAIYTALGDLMQTDIHALSINAYTPDEAPS
ncbi:MAG: BolA family protein [Pseudomonadota bacterium]